MNLLQELLTDLLLIIFRYTDCTELVMVEINLDIHVDYEWLLRNEYSSFYKMVKYLKSTIKYKDISYRNAYFSIFLKDISVKDKDINKILDKTMDAFKAKDRDLIIKYLTDIPVMKGSPFDEMLFSYIHSHMEIDIYDKLLKYKIFFPPLKDMEQDFEYAIRYQIKLTAIAKLRICSNLDETRTDFETLYFIFLTILENSLIINVHYHNIYEYCSRTPPNDRMDWIVLSHYIKRYIATYKKIEE
jgi:hypothetical protein